MFSLDSHIRIECVVLEYHRDIALARFEVVHDGVADADVTLGLVFKPGDHPQQRRFPRPRGTDEHEELPVLDLERDIVRRDDLVPAVVERLPDAV